jgi:hypothetical protein
MIDFPIRRMLNLQAASQAQIVRVKCKIDRGAAIDPIYVAEALGCEVRFMALPSLEGLYSPTPSQLSSLARSARLADAHIPAPTKSDTMNSSMEPASTNSSMTIHRRATIPMNSSRICSRPSC